jgi:hypothetical protein
LLRIWRKGILSTLLVGRQISAAIKERVGNFLKKLKIQLPNNPAIPFLGIYSKEMKLLHYNDFFTVMFIGYLILINHWWS